MTGAVRGAPAAAAAVVGPPAPVDWRQPTGGRLARVSAFVLAAYLVMWMVRLVLADQAPGAFDAISRWIAGDIARLGLMPVVWATVFHTFEGGRLLIGGLVREPGPAAGSDLARAVVVFGTWLVVIPAWAVLLGPVFESA